MENCFFYISRMYGVVGRGDHGHATAHEVGHERRQATEFAVQPVVLDRHVLTLDVAGFAEAFIERSGIAHGGLGRPGADEANDRHRLLLRARRQRPCHVPPSSAMNSRRLMGRASVRGLHATRSSSVVQHSKIWVPMTASGQ
jgi:hypothetical protein